MSCKTKSILESVRKLEFWWSQNDPDLNDRDEGILEVIFSRSDRSKMGRYDGHKNSKFHADSSIHPLISDL